MFKKKPHGRGQKPRPKGPPPAAAREREPAPPGKQGPPDRTLREAQYLTALVANKTHVRVKLRDNQEVEGVVEYYDAGFIRLTRDGDSNLFIYKDDIQYLEERP